MSTIVKYLNVLENTLEITTTTIYTTGTNPLGSKSRFVIRKDKILYLRACFDDLNGSWISIFYKSEDYETLTYGKGQSKLAIGEFELICEWMNK